MLRRTSKQTDKNIKKKDSLPNIQIKVIRKSDDAKKHQKQKIASFLVFLSKTSEKVGLRFSVFTLPTISWYIKTSDFINPKQPRNEHRY